MMWSPPRGGTFQVGAPQVRRLQGNNKHRKLKGSKQAGRAGVLKVWEKEGCNEGGDAKPDQAFLIDGSKEFNGLKWESDMIGFECLIFWLLCVEYTGERGRVEAVRPS